MRTLTKSRKKKLSHLARYFGSCDRVKLPQKYATDRTFASTSFVITCFHYFWGHQVDICTYTVVMLNFWYGIEIDLHWTKLWEHFKIINGDKYSHLSWQIITYKKIKENRVTFYCAYCISKKLNYRNHETSYVKCQFS